MSYLIIDICNQLGSGMSASVVAIVVIVCLLVVAGGGVFMFMFYKREFKLRKLMGLERSRPPQNMSSFDNVGYGNSTPSSTEA